MYNRYSSADMPGNEAFIYPLDSRLGGKLALCCLPSSFGP